MDENMNRCHRDIRSCFPDELETILADAGEPLYRAHQIFQWLHQHHAESWNDMTSISKKLRQKLSESLSLPAIEVLMRQASRLDRTVKYLFGFEDGQGVETVLMWYHYGASICVSSQVGCQMGCAFCASTLGGLIRNLTAGEMAHQVAAVHRLDMPAKERVHSLVIMGSGEPLENYDEVLRFLKLLNHPDGLGMSYRRMTVSTCGLVPEMRRLSEEGIPVNLSVSLHSVHNEVRDRLMPINRRYPVDILLQACQEYAKKTGRRLTFEYIMIANVNDSIKDAAALADKIRNIHCHVNLIPLNPVAEREYQRSSDKDIQCFADVLTERGIPVTVRRELGADIDAACGQLRRRNDQR